MKETHFISIDQPSSYELNSNLNQRFKENATNLNCKVNLIGYSRISGSAIFSVKCDAEDKLDFLVQELFHVNSYSVVPKLEDPLSFNRLNEIHDENTHQWIGDLDTDGSFAQHNWYKGSEEWSGFWDNLKNR